MPELLKRPADLKEVPAAYDQWPGESIKVACPHCGVWMTTSIEAETGDYYNVNSTLCIWHAQTTAVVMQHVKCR
ncbi:hypothetical protein HaLaN_14003 [Haematococcus lacustris]|uniref:LITAF domain-containing protein n=1 Tax=Haematococcus lacustris TaxID=44745 RepID=A0A699Z416_HAELA|nr:hypothetical protein HaLaN_14003 [Haematococcus lacustris]